MPEIAFLSRRISFKLTESKKTSSWLSAVVQSEGKEIESLAFIFSTDPFLASLNKKYLKHNTLTDIITFDYSEGGVLIAEIYISIPRVRENAKTYKQPFPRELRRVMVHGVLHVLGYKDKTTRESSQMRTKEEACLSLWA